MTQTIEQLTARVRELEEENERLRLKTINLKTQIEDDDKSAIATIDDLKGQLAASQLRETQLRVALQTFIDEHEECTDADDWMAMLCSIEAHHVAEEALALPNDTSALDAYVSENVKEASTQLLEKLEQLTQQRDLAVEALEKYATSNVRLCNLWAVEALSTIKESEAK